VRISRGKPKFWSAAERFPAVDELMPDGWMLSKSTDPAKAECAYRHKLTTIGLERIAARLDAIADECGGLPLCLCCFEADRADCHRSWAAAWLHEQTGLAVPEIGAKEETCTGGGDDLARTHTTPSGHSRPDGSAQLRLGGLGR
jgi:hypothetical protein